MKHHTFTRASGIIFLVIAGIHLIRVIEGWEVSIGGWTVPLWFSYVAVLLVGYLGVNGLRLSGK